MSEPTVLADFCELVSQQVNPASLNVKCTYLGLEHLASGRMKPVTSGHSNEVHSLKFAFRKGDVLYGKLRPYLDKAILADFAGVCTTELLVLRPKPGVNPRYLACMVHTPDFIEHAMSGVTGAHHPRTSWSHISQFPSLKLAENAQRTVADLLWRVHDMTIACETSERCAQALKQATMRELFTRGLRGEPQKESEIGPIPESWYLEELRDHHSVVSGGTPSRANSSYWVGGSIPWVKTTEIDYRVILDTEERITEAGLAESAAKVLPTGTLLLAMYGQGVTRGRVAILGIDAACNQACAGIQATDDDIDTKYLYHFLAYRYEAIRQLAHGGQQQNLNLDIVREIPIAYPPDKDEQREIVSILDAIDRKIELCKQKRAVLEDLFKALLHKLMTGEIRMSDLDLSVLEPAADSGRPS